MVRAPSKSPQNLNASEPHLTAICKIYIILDTTLPVGETHLVRIALWCHKKGSISLSSTETSKEMIFLASLGLMYMEEERDGLFSRFQETPCLYCTYFPNHSPIITKKE